MAIALLIIVGIAVVVLGAGWLAWQSTYGYTPPSRYTNTRPTGESDRTVGFLGGMLPWQMDRVGELADRWARDNQYELVDSEYRFWREGPFWWRSSEAQVVQRITVRDRYGRERRGYLRSGHWLFGLWDDSVSVEWDEPSPRERWRR